jgi:hypothetical protein
MKNKILLGLVLILICAAGVLGLQTQTFSPQPIKIEEADALKLQLAFQQFQSAQTQMENALLRAKMKYKVGADWDYDFARGAFIAPTPPTIPAPTPKKDDKPSAEKPK